MTVSLTGFMGCGKSSIGRELVRQIGGCRLIDLDEWIESRSGRKIREIFAEEGESGFRRMEADALGEIFGDGINGGEVTVLSLGGGTLTAPGAAELVKAHSVCVYLRASVETLRDNLLQYPGDRPMMQGAKGIEKTTARIRTLMDARSGIYEKAADYILDIDGKDYVSAASEIRALIFR